VGRRTGLTAVTKREIPFREWNPGRPARRVIYTDGAIPTPL